MSVSLKKRSRLRFASLLSADGYEFWDMLEFPTFPERPDDTVYRVRGGDRMDLIASNVYGDPILWWVIAVVNDLDLVPTDLKEGSILKIPSADAVRAVLTKATQ